MPTSLQVKPLLSERPTSSGSLAERDRLLDIRVEHDADIVLSRRITRQIALLLQCSPYYQSSLGTAVSDVVRTVFQRAQACSVLYFLDRTRIYHSLVIEVISERTFAGVPWDGIEAMKIDGDDPVFRIAQRFVDRLGVDQTERGTRVTLVKKLPRNFSAEEVLRVSGRLKNRKPDSLVEELQLQNQELIRALETYQARYRDLRRQHSHLEESNILLLETNATLQEKAARDPLTRLYNRLRFREVIQEKLYAAASQEESFSIILFDLDDFKKINDSYGHAVGDRVLMEIADVVSIRLREGDWFFRIGGEEFVVIPDHCGLDGAVSLAGQLRECVENHEIEDLIVTCSFGVTAFREGDDYHSVFERVDTAMYRAKEMGKNRVEVIE